MEKPFPAYEGSEPYVFVCYSHEDSAVIYPELVRIRDAGFHVWYDEGIAPGSEWSEALARQIENCAVFLFFVTPRAVASEHCRREVNYALEQRGGMLAVHLEPTDVPRGLKLSLSNRQAILRYGLSEPAYATKLIEGVRQAAVRIEDRQTLTIGEWRIAPERNELVQGAEVITLQPKAMDVLVHLVQANGEPVSTEELLEACWPDSVVVDAVVYNRIAELRAALEDDARNPAYIRTVPGRGYAAINGAVAQTAPIATARPSRNWIWAAAGAAVLALGIVATQIDFGRTPESIAVEAFVDKSPEPGNEWIGISLSDAIRSGLRRLGIRTLVAGAEAHLNLRGSSRLIDEALTLDVELVEAATGEIRWSQRYERPMVGIWLLEEMITADIAKVVQLELVPDEQLIDRGTQSREAYLAFLTAAATGEMLQCDFWEARANGLQRALEFDPYFTLAQAFLSANTLEYWLACQPDDIEVAHLAHQRNERTLEISRDPYTRAFALYQRAMLPSPAGPGYDYPAAEAGLRDALSLPRDAYLEWFNGSFGAVDSLEQPYAFMLQQAGLYTASAAYWDLVRELHIERDGILPGPQQFMIGPGLLYARRFDDLAAHYRQYGGGITHRAVGLAAVVENRFDDAQAVVDEMRAILAGEIASYWRAPIKDMADSLEVVLLAARGEVQQARDMFDEGDFVIRGSDVLAWTGFATRDEYFKVVEEQFQTPSGRELLRWLYRRDAELLRPDLMLDPRWDLFLERLNLSDAWRAEFCERAKLLTPHTGVEITCPELSR